MNNLNYDVILKITQDFYAKAKVDFMIGYHFRFIESFDEHIPRIADFWYLQLSGKIQNKSHLPFYLIEVHKKIGTRQGEYGRWQSLFTEVLEAAVQSKTITNEEKNEWISKIELFKGKILTQLTR